MLEVVKEWKLVINRKKADYVATQYEKKIVPEEKVKKRVKPPVIPEN